MDRLQCSICGKWYRALGHHVAKAHGVSARDYKIAHDLPVTRGIATDDVREAFAEIRRRTDTPESKVARAATLAALPPRQKGELPQYALAQSAKRMLALSGLDAPYAAAQYARVVDQIRAGVTITAACQAAGLPAWTTLHDYIVADPERRQAWDAMWDALPYAQQAASKKLEARFRAEAAALRADGLTWREVGARLGVGEEVARRQCMGRSKPPSNQDTADVSR